jgi:hypothetical protein
MTICCDIYCNVDDEAFLGNDPVTQQWKGSDHCYTMAQYTGANNGVEDVFCGRCGGYIRSDNITESTEKSAEVVQEVRNVRL